MRRTTAALTLLVGLLSALSASLAWKLLELRGTGAANAVSVQVTSDPPGAHLSSLDGAREYGVAPITMTYSTPEAWASCLSFKGVHARWADGASLLAQRLELCPDGGRDQVIRITRPNGGAPQKCLLPYFGGRRMAAITTADIRALIVKRQTDRTTVHRAHDVVRKDSSLRHVPKRVRVIDGVSAGEINRELTVLKRIFSLAMQSGKLLHRPHIPMLRENNIRTGFFEQEQLGAVLNRLPNYARPVVRFAYLTGWRVASEVLTLQWRHVDFAGSEISLDAGTTKNDEARVFPMTSDLRSLLEAQQKTVDALKARKAICPYVFHRDGGCIKSFVKSWKAACAEAGCPGRILHDLRRTAVRNIVRAGVPERVAMQLTGHKTRSVFERYNIVSRSDIAVAHRLLDPFGGQTDRVDERSPRS